MTWLIIGLIASVLLNLLLFWYIRNILGKLLFVSDNIGYLLEKADEYTEHLDIVYNLETFYGEPVLENLLKHSKSISDEIKKFHSIYSLTQDEVTEESDEEDEEDEEEEEDIAEKEE